MADVLHFRTRKLPKIETLRRTVESTCRTYDKGITTCIWLFGALLVWFLLASVIITPSTAEYEQAAFQGAATAYAPSGRREERRLHRALSVLETACDGSDSAPDVAVGPHVQIDGKPYMTRVLRVCASGVTLLNPYIAVTGSEQGACVDEVDGRTRTVSRSYPITLHADNREPYTLLDLDQVCPVMQALDMLDGIW